MQNLSKLLESDAFYLAPLLAMVLASVFLFTLYFLPDEQKIAARRRLGFGDSGGRTASFFLLRVFRPIYRPIATLLPEERFWAIHLKTTRLLEVARLRDEISPHEFLAWQFVMAIFMTLFLAQLFSLLGSPPSFLSWPLFAIVGYFFPLFWLKERIRIRKTLIKRALPYALDLITLSVEAGLDFIAAIQRLTQRAKPNLLLEEFSQMLREIRLGTSRSDALRNLSRRIQLEEITSLTTLLIQADKLGASVGEVLRAQSEQIRTKRFHDAEAAGARASQLILFPLIFCILPATFIVLLAPPLLSFLQGGLF